MTEDKTTKRGLTEAVEKAAETRWNTVTAGTGFPPWSDLDAANKAAMREQMLDVLIAFDAVQFFELDQ